MREDTRFALVSHATSPSAAQRLGSVLGGIGISFLILFLITQAQKTRTNEPPPMVEDLRAAVVSAPPPPPPRLQQAQPPPPADIKLMPAPTDSPVTIPPTLLPEIAPARPMAEPNISFSLDDFKPNVADAQANPYYVYERSEVDQVPVIIVRRRPEISRSLLDDVELARIRLLYVVNTEGRAEAIQVLGSVSPEFDRLVIDALKDYRFRPAVKDGRKVRCWVRHSIRVKKKSGASPFTID